MSVKSTAFIVITAATLATGALTALEPKTATEQSQQQVEQLSHSDEQRKEHLRDRIPESVDRENAQKLIPGEYRPRVPRFRLP